MRFTAIEYCVYYEVLLRYIRFEENLKYLNMRSYSKFYNIIIDFYAESRNIVRLSPFRNSMPRFVLLPARKEKKIF